MPKDIYAYLSEIIFDGGQFDFAGHKTLALRGAEAQSFLHNQSSNNIVKMENNSFQINALLDISAKLIGFFYVLKVNPQELYVVSHSEFFEEIVERLEKYLIAEDVGLNVLDQALYGYMGTRCLKNLNDQKAFKGMFAGEEAFLSFTDHKRSIIDSEKLNFLKIVTGHPEWRETIHEKELFNNTSLIDLAYDKDKGCFLGQETVAKVESRRGAAFKPLLLINSLPMKAPQALDQLRLNGKKIGKALASSVLGGQTYILASLNREARIEGKMLEFDEPTVFKATAKYLPLYAFFDKAGGFYHFAVDNFQKGDEQISEEFLLKAIEADPSFEDAYESLGVLYGRQEKYEKAIELMDQLAKLNKKSVMAHTNLSLYYMKVGEIEKAEEEKSLATIMQFESLGEEAEKKRRLVEEQKRQQEEIEKRESMFRQVLEIDPEDTLANYGLGEIEYLKENYAKSIAHLQTAISSQKNYSVAWLQLAKSFIALRREEEAKATLQEGIAIAGKNGDLMPANEMQRLLSELK